MSKSDNIANVVVLALGTFVAYHSYHSLKLGMMISPGAGFLPFLCGIALILLGIVWRLQTILFRSPPPPDDPAEAVTAACEAAPAPLPRSRVKLVLAFLVTLTYAWLFERIGFLLSTLLFMLGWQMLVERERWLKTVLVTVISAAAMYALFRSLLHVELPSVPWL
jgi:putative tricarboxylic transport membrane protein